MVGVTASDQKTCECFSYARSSRFRPVPVEVAQSLAHAAAIVHRSGELSRGSSRLAFLSLDTSTVLGATLA
jgi:hypothetical protein